MTNILHEKWIKFAAHHESTSDSIRKKVFITAVRVLQIASQELNNIRLWNTSHQELFDSMMISVF